MITAYLEGLRLHAEYVRRSRTIPRLVVHGIVGALVDIAAPWYALATRPTRNDFIPKDRPAALARLVKPAATD